MLIRSISIGASTVAVASSFFFAYMQNLPAVASKPSYKPGFSRTFIEMMPEGSSESYRVHVRDESGLDTEIRIRYVDGSNGKLFLYANGRVRQECLYFLDGSIRKDAYYDESGLLLSGIELREDKSTLWEAKLTGSKVLTTAFWTNSKKFMERLQDLESRNTDETFYRHDGSLWQTRLKNGSGRVLEQHFFDLDGNLRIAYSFDTDIKNTTPARVTYYGEKRHLDFEQRFGYAADSYFDSASGGENPNRLVIESISIYNNEKLSTRLHLLPSGRLLKLEKFLEGGVIERSFVNGFNITQIETERAGNRVSKYDFEGAFGRAPPIDSRFLRDIPSSEVPNR